MLRASPTRIATRVANARHCSHWMWIEYVEISVALTIRKSIVLSSGTRPGNRYSSSCFSSSRHSLPFLCRSTARQAVARAVTGRAASEVRTRRDPHIQITPSEPILDICAERFRPLLPLLRKLTIPRHLCLRHVLIFCHPLRLLHRLLPLQLRRLLRLARSIAAGGGGRGG